MSLDDQLERNHRHVTAPALASSWRQETGEPAKCLARVVPGPV